MGTVRKLVMLLAGYEMVQYVLPSNGNGHFVS